MANIKFITANKNGKLIRPKNYAYPSGLSLGTLIPISSLTVDYLIVAGGGGGGGFYGGGGGAGGLLQGSTTLTNNSNTVTVGGAGQNSVFNGLTSIAGGNGGGLGPA